MVVRLSSSPGASASARVIRGTAFNEERGAPHSHSLPHGLTSSHFFTLSTGRRSSLCDPTCHCSEPVVPSRPHCYCPLQPLDIRPLRGHPPPVLDAGDTTTNISTRHETKSSLCFLPLTIPPCLVNRLRISHGHGAAGISNKRRILQPEAARLRWFGSPRTRGSREEAT